MDEFDGTGIDDEDCSDLEALFTAASNHVTALASSLSQTDLLYLYGRYKQVIDGPCTTQRPGMFDFKGKQKWDSWKILGDKSKEEAMQEYVDKVSSISSEFDKETAVQRDSGSGGGGLLGGVSVSKPMCHEESNKADADKTIFDWVVDGDMSKVKQFLAADPNIDIDAKDEQGMSVLHWAVDRGCTEIVELLIVDHDADVNVRDDDRQTPLHYACSCEWVDIVEILMFHGADPDLMCVDDMIPARHTKNARILSLMGR